MHWYEAMLAFCETDAHASSHCCAMRHRRFFEDALVDNKSAMLGEFYGADWRPHPGGLGDVVELGHVAERVWLLRRNETIAGLRRYDIAGQLLQESLAFQCSETGWLVDEARRDGSVAKPTRRIWLQTELWKAQIGQFEAGHHQSLASARESLEQLDYCYLRRAGLTSSVTVPFIFNHSVQ